MVEVVPEGTPGGQRAGLSYRVIGSTPNGGLLEVRPVSGRSHQIRVQLASRELPILGDKKYGATSIVTALDGKPRVALHASELTFKHPTRDEMIRVVAPVPGDWPWESGESRES